MKKSMQIGVALVASALLVAGGSAYTAANTLTADPLIGDGSNSVSGVTVTTTDYTYTDSSGDTLDSVVYTVSDDLTTNTTTTAAITPAGTGTTSACTITNATTITCDHATVGLGYTVADLTAIALSVQTSQTT